MNAYDKAFAADNMTVRKIHNVLQFNDLIFFVPIKNLCVYRYEI